MPRIRTAAHHLMDAAAAGQAPTADEVNNLPAARDADPDDVREARAEIRRRGRVIADLRAQGNHGLSRRIAREVSEEYGHLFDTDGPNPPNVTNLDPRAIADLIVGRSPGGR